MTQTQFKLHPATDGFPDTPVRKAIQLDASTVLLWTCKNEFWIEMEDFKNGVQAELGAVRKELRYESQKLKELIADGVKR